MGTPEVRSICVFSTSFMEHLERSLAISAEFCIELSEYRTHGLKQKMVSVYMELTTCAKQIGIDRKQDDKNVLSDVPRQRRCLLSFWWSSSSTISVALFKVRKLLLKLVDSTGKAKE